MGREVLRRERDFGKGRGGREGKGMAGKGREENLWLRM
jgi:hypothetical protein